MGTELINKQSPCLRKRPWAFSVFGTCLRQRLPVKNLEIHLTDDGISSKLLNWETIYFCLEKKG